jgi:hypothetical protein
MVPTFTTMAALEAEATASEARTLAMAVWRCMSQVVLSGVSASDSSRERPCSVRCSCV